MTGLEEAVRKSLQPAVSLMSTFAGAAPTAASGRQEPVMDDRCSEINWFSRQKAGVIAAIEEDLSDRKAANLERPALPQQADGTQPNSNSLASAPSGLALGN